MSEELDLMDDLDGMEDTQKGMFMTFQITDECYGIAITYVQEIVGIQSITAVPETEDYIRGLINIRGKIIPVIDVRVRLKQDPRAYTDRTCIIVIGVKSTVVGLIVDEIAGVITVNEKEIILPPSLSQSNAGSSKYVFGLARVDNEVKLLLDPEKLIRDEDVEAFEESAPVGEIAEA
ncbi:MAG: purine-binding chemotaxis protein CheW [Lachnospiraceae bacterium]|nr:purine-binding chemotaxis protein CheW [Lachnospiraceae bacterium]